MTPLTAMRPDLPLPPDVIPIAERSVAHAATQIGVSMTRKTMLSASRLRSLLGPQGFVLCRDNRVSREISFCRPAQLDPLYEHLQIFGQGKAGEAVYARTSVSASPLAPGDPAVAERDDSLKYAIETDAVRHWTLLRTASDAVAWEQRLAEQADRFSRETARVMGPRLLDRLQPMFNQLGKYLEALGDIDQVFASEDRYLRDAPALQRSEAERLQLGFGSTADADADVAMACMAVARHGPNVEGRPTPFAGVKVHEDATLRALLQLLTAHFVQRRKTSASARGT